MEDTTKFTELTERLLASVEAQQEAIQLMQSELTAHGAALCEMLAWLRRPADRNGTAQAATTPSSTPPASAESEESQNRRSLPRRKGNHISVLITHANADATLQGVVAERSPDGLCLVVDQEIPVGTLLRVRPLQSLTACGWFAAEVRSCRPELKVWIIGCRFTQRLTWSNLRLFG